MGRTLVAAIVALGYTFALPVAAQNADDVRVRVSGRVQIQFNTTSIDDDDLDPSEPIAASTFETRRVRLTVDVAVRDWITGIMEPEFALGELSLRRAYVDLGIDDAFALRVGQFKKPFSLVFLTSSLETVTIERGLRIRGLEEAYARSDAGAGVWGGIPSEEHELLDALGYLAYELGAAAHGELGPVAYEIGVFNGAGQDERDTNDGKSFAGRAVVGVGETPLALGGAFSYREAGTGESVGGTAFSVDAEWGAFREAGLHLVAEAVTGENMAVDERFRAAHAMAGWFRPVGGRRIEGVEGVARVSWADPNLEIDGDAGVLLTPGINVYFVGRNRLMLNWDVFIPQGDAFETEQTLRAQAQLAF
ncbi:MAG: porin [Longimicrobiales bacterium]